MQYYLSHHGVVGQRWGVRRYQNKDGSFTPVGRKRSSRYYSRKLSKQSKKTADYKSKYEYSFVKNGAHSMKTLAFKQKYERGKAFVDALINSAYDNGYSVSEHPFKHKFLVK